MNKIFFLRGLLVLVLLIVYQPAASKSGSLVVQYTDCQWVLPNYFSIDLRNKLNSPVALPLYDLNNKKNSYVYFLDKEMSVKYKDEARYKSLMEPINIGNFQIRHYTHDKKKGVDVIYISHNDGDEPMEVLSIVNIDNNESFFEYAIKYSDFWEMFNHCQKTYKSWDSNIKRYQVEFNCDDENESLCELGSVEVQPIKSTR